MNAQPNTRIFLVTTGAAALLCVIAGPFGTGVLSLPTRTLLWATLIGFNALKWWAWYRALGPRLPDRPSTDVALAAGGGLILNATLPLEIAWVYRAVGIAVAFDWLSLWLLAVLISVVISTVIAAISWRRPPTSAETPAPAPPPSSAAPLRGLALKADLSRLMAITTEDHYLRLHMEGGERPLILYRFGDAVADLAPIDGLQIHRGAWVATRAVRGAERQGRRCWLILADGTRLPVSDRHLPAVRARGWLAR